MGNLGRVGRRALVVLAFLLAFGGAWAQSTYFVQADVVRGGIGAMGAVCVFNGVFFPGEQIVWRAYVYDAETGERLTAEEVAAKGVTVSASLDSEEKAQLRFIPHPPNVADGEYFWAGGWQIPTDYATGTYEWSLTVTDSAGNTGEYHPMGSALGLGAISIVEQADQTN